MATRDALGWTQPDYQALSALSQRLNVPPEWVAGVMYSESGMRPNKKNGLGYQGLIQFGRDVLKEMFHLTDAQVDNFAKLTVSQQLPYVEKYFNYWKPESGYPSRMVLYQATFVPGTIKTKGTQNSTVLARKPNVPCPLASRGDIFCANAALSTDGKVITVGDLDKRIDERIKEVGTLWPVALDGIASVAPPVAVNIPLPAGVEPISYFKPQSPTAIPGSSWTTILIGGSILAFAGYQLYTSSKRSFA